MKYKVLIIEEEQDNNTIWTRIVDYNLCITQFLHDYNEAQKYINESPFPDLVILSLGKLSSDGLSFLQLLSEKAQSSDLPVIVYTEVQNLTHKLATYSMGIDDYIVAPIHELEFKARIELRLRKKKLKNFGANKIRIGAFTFDLKLMRASYGPVGHEKDLGLTFKEFKVLLYLAQNEGQLFTRAELMEAIWEEKVHILNRTVDTHICGLRKKMGHLSPCLISFAGRGYAFHSNQTL